MTDALCIALMIACWIAFCWRPRRKQTPLPPQPRGCGIYAEKQWKYKTGWGSRPL